MILSSEGQTIIVNLNLIFLVNQKTICRIKDQLFRSSDWSGLVHALRTMSSMSEDKMPHNVSNIFSASD